jgi:hypothetical protein
MTAPNPKKTIQRKRKKEKKRRRKEGKIKG